MNNQIIRGMYISQQPVPPVLLTLSQVFIYTARFRQMLGRCRLAVKIPTVICRIKEDYRAERFRGSARASGGECPARGSM